MEIIIKIDAAELSEDMLAQIIKKGATGTLKAKAPATSAQEATETTQDAPANPDPDKDARKASTDRKAEILARLTELGADLPKKGSKLPTWEKALVEAEAKASEPDPAEDEGDESWEDSEPGEETEVTEYEYGKTHALARKAVSASDEKGALMRRLLDKHIGDGVGLKQAFEDHLDKVGPLVAELETVAGAKYGEE